MADTDRIKRNLGKMIDQGAPETDINAYLKTEGFNSPEDWRAAITPNAPTMSGGGVQDYEPIATRHIGATELPQDEFAGRVVTRIRNAATGLVGIPRAMADIVKSDVPKAGLPDWMVNTNPIALIGQYLPSSQQMNEAIGQVLPPVNAKTTAGKLVDTGTEAALGGLMLGGGASTLAPSFVGGAASEGAGQLTKGTPYEPAARVIGGMAGGLGTGLAQNALQSTYQGVRNLAPNVDETAAKIWARNLERDKMTPDQLVSRQADLGPNAPLVEAGGPNVRGMVRGAVMPPGEARTTTTELFDARRAELPERVANALNTNVSPQGSLGATVEELNALRAQQSTPAYEAAGIPNRPEMTSPARTVRFAIDQPPTEIPAQFNTPSFTSPRLEQLINDSADMRAAIGAARRLPDYKDLPTNSMAMLDKAYKHINGMEQEAIRAGNGTRAHDLAGLRKDLLDALTEVNPRYGRALEAYATPSKLIDASERGRDWFAKKVDPAIVQREFQQMTPEQQRAALVGARDWGRTAVEETKVGIPSDKVFGSASAQKRWEAILPPTEFNALKKEMGNVTNTANTIADIRVGSRTTPAALETADNAMQSTALTAANDFAWGHPVAATWNALKGALKIVGQGRTEAVNARIAEIARMVDPKEVGMVAALANKQALEQAIRSSERSNALLYGAMAPAIEASSGNRQ